jgi:hypothetical protein
MASTGQVAISGTVTAGPTTSGDTVFPAGVTNIPFTLNIAQKAYGASSGAQSEAVASPSSFVTLAGINASVGTVKNCNTLYLRTSAAMDVRITQNNPLGGTTVSLVKQVKGLFIVEVDDLNAILLVEVQGTGTVEWGAWGNS